MTEPARQHDREREPAPTIPPVRVADRLANERTFLAWIRTSLSLITFGFVIAKFSVWLRQLTATLGAVDPGVHVPPSRGSLPAGLILMVFGASMAGLALARHRRIERAIDAGGFPQADRMVLLLTAAVVVVAVALALFLLLTA